LEVEIKSALFWMACSNVKASSSDRVSKVAPRFAASAPPFCRYSGSMEPPCRETEFPLKPRAVLRRRGNASGLNDRLR
jgi:hypothetical protein